MTASSPLAGPSCRKRTRSIILRSSLLTGLTHLTRYLIMNYEHNNFSVAQSRFDYGVPANIIATPSNSTAIHINGSRIGRKTVIVLSIGVTTFIILIAVALRFVTRRWWSNAKTRNSNKKGALKLAPEPEALTAIPPQEIGHNSLCGNCQELHDSGKVELLDDRFPSGSGNIINELPQLPQPLLEELITHPDSHTAAMARDLYATNRWAVYVSTETIRESRRSVGSAVLSPYIESVITTSPTLPRRLSLKVNKTLPSIPFSSISRVIRSSPSERNALKDLNGTSIATVRTKSLLPHRGLSLDELDGSLPSTPISETSQVLPLVLSVDNGSFEPQRPQPLLSRALKVESPYATVFDYDLYKDSTVVSNNSVDAV